MSRSPTEAQKAAATERRAKFRELAQRIADMPDTERAALAHQAGAVLNCEGRPLSPANTLLLFIQRPGVSMVGGFRQWIKAGRCVRKGERGLSIWVPVGGKAADEAAGEPGEKPGFISGTVFDVSQTCEQSAETQASEPRAEPTPATHNAQPAYSEEFTQVGA